MNWVGWLGGEFNIAIAFLGWQIPRTFPVFFFSSIFSSALFNESYKYKKNLFNKYTSIKNSQRKIKSG